jgi:hypothetical protein
MKLIPYNPACHEAGWPLATVTLRITTKGHDVDPHSCCDIVRENIVSIHTTTMTIALPQWLVHDGEANPDYLDCEGVLMNCNETEDLYAGWAEVAVVYEVLSIRPIHDEEDN